MFIVVLDIPLLDTRRQHDLTGTLISDIVLQLLSYVAQTEREMIRRRQAEGIAAAKERGAHLGRPVTAYPADWDEVYKHWRSGELTAVAAMHELGLKRSTFYKLVRRYEEGRE